MVITITGDTIIKDTITIGQQYVFMEEQAIEDRIDDSQRWATTDIF